jgi:hypothetical protein
MEGTRKEGEARKPSLFKDTLERQASRKTLEINATLPLWNRRFHYAKRLGMHGRVHQMSPVALVRMGK